MQHALLGEHWGEEEGAGDSSNALKFLYSENQEVMVERSLKETKISTWAVVQNKAKAKEETTLDVVQAQSVRHLNVSRRAIEWDIFRLKILSFEDMK